jgi:hypothetical protein
LAARTENVLPARVKATPIEFTNTLRDALLRVTYQNVSAEPSALLRRTTKLGKIRIYSMGLYFGMYANGWTIWHVRQWMDDGSSSSNNNHLRFLVDDVPATSSHKATT